MLRPSILHWRRDELIGSAFTTTPWNLGHCSSALFPSFLPSLVEDGGYTVRAVVLASPCLRSLAMVRSRARLFSCFFAPHARGGGPNGGGDLDSLILAHVRDNSMKIKLPDMSLPQLNPPNLSTNYLFPKHSTLTPPPSCSLQHPQYYQESSLRLCPRNGPTWFFPLCRKLSIMLDPRVQNTAWPKP